MHCGDYDLLKAKPKLSASILNVKVIKRDMLSHAPCWCLPWKEENVLHPNKIKLDVPWDSDYKKLQVERL